MKRTKKAISLLLSIVITFSSLCGTNVIFASNVMKIYSEDIDCNIDDKISVPIYIDNNDGLIAWEISIDFDENLLKPTEVRSGKAIKESLGEDVVVENTLGGDFYKAGHLVMKWNCADGNKVFNGELVVIDFKVSKFASGNTSIKINYSQVSTFDEDLNDVIFDCSKGSNIFIKNNNSNIINVESDENLMTCTDEIINIPVFLKNNQGVYAFTFDFEYDNTKLKYISYTGNKALFKGNFLDEIIYENSVEISWYTNDSSDKSGLLLTLQFEVLSDINDDSTNITINNIDENFKAERYDAKIETRDIELLINHIPVVTALELKSFPDKLTYELYEEFDPNGMVIEAVKDDGTTQTVTDGYTVTGFDTDSVGTKTITVSYEGQSVSFDIEVSHTHKWGEWEVISSPNCVDKGFEKRTCEICKESETRDIDPLGHEWESDYTVDVKPTCEAAGSKSINCKNCEATKEVTEISPLGHDYEGSVTKAATCTEDGIKTYVCKNDASHTYTEAIPKLGHNYTGTVTKEPTCEENGIKTYVCANDSSHTYTEEIPMLGHNYELTETVKPTCTEDGKNIFTCKNDSTHIKEEVLKATGHTCSDWIVDKNPTYLENGTKHKECTVCKEVLETESILMLDDITAPEIEITVNNNTFKSFVNNITFGLFFKENVDVTISASDDESGVEKIEYIKTNTPISESEITSRTEWTTGDSLTVSNEEEFIIYVKVTDKRGNASYAGTDGMVIDKTYPEISGITDNAVYCSQITFSASDKYFNNVIINGNEALSDSGEYTLIPSQTAYQITACDKAGNETSYTVTVNDGHTYGEWITDKAASCTQAGEKHRVCSVCGYEESEKINALGHEYSSEFTVDKAATCTENGEKSRHCSRCDARTDVTVINATGHTFGEWETVVSPDCTNSGSRQRVCKNCGFTETDNLNPNGHNWNTDYTIDIPETCTTDGSKSIHCANCDAVKDSQVIPAKGHSFGDFQVVKQATCVDNGSEKRVCADCGYSETREIIALGHDYADKFTVDKAATCIENGEKSRHCSRCDSRTEITVIDALGHSYGEWITDTAATKLEQGSQHKVCTVCGDTVYEVIPKLQYIADSKDNKVELNSLDIEQGGTLQFTVTAAGTDNLNPIKDDTRYIPVEWKVGNVTGGFSTAPYSAMLYTSEMTGGQTLEISYSVQVFDGNEWANTGETFMQSAMFTVYEKPTEPSTEPEQPSALQETTKQTAQTENTTSQSDEATEKSETTTQKSDSNPNRNTSKTSPETGNTAALPVAVSTAFVLALVCVITKKKKDD